MRGEGLSASDVALISRSNEGNNNGFGNGFGDGAWWIIILFLFIFCGWGNNNWGNGNGGNNGSGSVMDAYVLSSDFATLQRLIADGFTSVSTGINQVNQGICSLGYQTLENFNTTNMNVANGFSNLNNALCNQSFQIERGITGLESQLANCCCGLKSDIQGINYSIAMNTNAIQQTLCNNTRDVIENQNANYRALHDEIVANRIEDKNAQIAELQTKLNNAELRASQEAQTNYLYTSITDKLSPCPRPAYLTCNPNTPFNYTVVPNNCCSCNGCGNY